MDIREHIEQIGFNDKATFRDTDGEYTVIINTNGDYIVGPTNSTIKPLTTPDINKIVLYLTAVLRYNDASCEIYRNFFPELGGTYGR